MAGVGQEDSAWRPGVCSWLPSTLFSLIAGPLLYLARLCLGAGMVCVMLSPQGDGGGTVQGLQHQESHRSRLRGVGLGEQVH